MAPPHAGAHTESRLIRSNNSTEIHYKRGTTFPRQQPLDPSNINGLCHIPPLKV
jgi:hypothetical protein